MKEAEYLAMSDRERDAWVHESIMGNSGKRAWDWEVWWPRYSTDYNAMMRVVEKMRGDGWEIILGVHNKAWCHLGRNLSDDWRKAKLHQVTNESLQHAVYLAAGLALGVIE